ncbi:recombinase family protein [Shinella sedimenti]|uniref:Recombinase family protein n=1 Tax=Shinella sedimenti TaxID=2919913 RepID=A0ABT0CSE1_9HYPH|nr:recombinase family protein [Shinella sedimenti]MCJ8151518.1 recombinase family protein [Shinella sedimenti]
MEEYEMKFTEDTVAYSYIRISSSKQALGDGPGRQIALSEAYAARHGLKLDEALEDIGRSGWSGANVYKGALGRFLDMISSGQVVRGSVLLVESLDRLSRQHPMDAQVILTSILTSGVNVVTLDDNNVYSAESLREDWTELIRIISIQARAHGESQRKSNLSKSAIQKRRALALEGKAKFTTNVPAWISQYKDRDGVTQYELNEHADTIRKIFALAKDGCGQMTITKELNRLKLPTYRKKSTGWHQTGVGRILDNHAAYGTFIPILKVGEGKEQIAAPIPNYFPAVISEEDFHIAQRHRTRRIVKGRKGNRFTNLFNGMCTCEHCFGNMSINYSGPPGKQKPILRCYNSWRGVGCSVPAKYFDYESLERVVLDTVREFGISDFVGHKTKNTELAAIEEAIRRSHGALAEIECKEENLVGQMQMVSAASASVLHKALDKLQVEKTDTEKVLKQAKQERDIMLGAMSDFSDIDRIIQENRRQWPMMDDIEVFRSRSQVNAALRYLFSHFLFDAQKHVASLVFENGLFAYHFKDGKLESTTDLISSGLVGPKAGAMTLDHFTSHISNPTDEAGRRVLETAQDRIKKYMIARNQRSPSNREAAANPRLDDPTVQRLKAERQARAKAWLAEMEERKRSKQ